MSMIIFKAMPEAEARRFQAGGADAYGLKPERMISDGDGVPCRHCLQCVAKGEAYLVLAYRPFASLQPYAETGPIFLHAEECRRAADSSDVPPMLARRESHLIKGYGNDERIVYGTGAVVRSADLAEAAGRILARDDVAFVHLRSSKNNCFTCKIDRADAANSAQCAT